MERLKDYECPRVCEGRNGHCHETCGRHKKYRELNEEKLKKEQQDKLTCSDSLRKNIKTQNRF
jgi:hypothetical protein